MRARSSPNHRTLRAPSDESGSSGNAISPRNATERLILGGPVLAGAREGDGMSAQTRDHRVSAWSTLEAVGAVSILLVSGLITISVGGYAETPAHRPGSASTTTSAPAQSALNAAEASLGAKPQVPPSASNVCPAVSLSSVDCGPSAADLGSPATGSYQGWGNETPYLGDSPSPRYDAAMVYDANTSDGYVVLFGGEGPGGPLGDTWIFQGGAWINVTPAVPDSTNTPSPRFGAAIAYDPSDGYVVLFGGADGANTGANDPALSDTWEFLHGTWTRLCSGCTPGVSEPGPRMLAAASGDPDLDGVVLFGGTDVEAGQYVPLNDTWLFSAGSWSEIPFAPGPSARFGAGLLWNGTSGPITLEGGCGASSPTPEPACTQPLGDVWTFAAGAWSSSTQSSGAPPARSGTGWAASSTSPTILGYGGLTEGGYLNETWQLYNGTWTDLTDGLLWSPSAREGSSLVYDPASGVDRYLLFGGWNGTYIGETWEYPSPFSPLRVTPPAPSLPVTDAGHAIWINVSVAGGAGSYNRTWFGLPDGCSSRNTSSLVCHPRPPGSSGTSSFVRVRILDAVGSIVWSPAVLVQVNPSPIVEVIDTLPNNLGLAPLTVEFIAVMGGGTLPYTYNWSFGTGATGTGNPVNYTYTVPGNYLPSVYANDSLLENASGRVAVKVALPLSVVLTVTPSSTTTGSSVTFFAAISGGLSPYSFLWSGLPASCSPNDGPSVTCSTGTPGQYSVSVAVTDLIGENVTGSVGLTVERSEPISAWLPWVGLAAGSAAAVVIVLLVRRRRRGAPNTAQPTAPMPRPPSSGPEP